MTKAIRMMQDNLRLVDALIYVIDARAVYSCDNPLFNKMITGKKVLYVFNKCDLVDGKELEAWCEYFRENGKPYVKAVGTSGDCSQIIDGLKQVTAQKIQKYADKGAVARVRAMVVGVPNSGKSTIINAMVKKAKAVTGDRPGVTRGKQWLSIDNIDFLDTPGTLWGKFDNQNVAHHLAYIGSIREDVLDISDLAIDFLDEMKLNYPQNLKDRYGLENLDDDTVKLLEDIAVARGFKARGNQIDYERTAKTVLDEFRKGKLGKVMLETPMSVWR